MFGSSITNGSESTWRFWYRMFKWYIPTPASWWWHAAGDPIWYPGVHHLRPGIQNGQCIKALHFRTQAIHSTLIHTLSVGTAQLEWQTRCSCESSKGESSLLYIPVIQWNNLVDSHTAAKSYRPLRHAITNFLAPSPSTINFYLLNRCKIVRDSTGGFPRQHLMSHPLFIE